MKSKKSSSGDKNSALEDYLKNILSSVKPSENDNVTRVGAIKELKKVIKSIPGSSTISSRGAIVNPYGSYVTNFYSKGSNLNISVDGLMLPWFNFKPGVEQLTLVMQALEKTGIARNVKFEPEAKVPVLSYESEKFNISCDVTVDNHLARIKSKILSKINDLDPRFCDLVLLVKEWAKMQNINDIKSGILNSYSLCLLVIFHLQTCEPPILPPISEIYEGNLSDDIAGFTSYEGIFPSSVRCIDEMCDKNIAKIKSQAYKSRNQSSLSELIVAFINKFINIGNISRDSMICTYSGKWEKIKRNPSTKYTLFIEDPFDKSENTAKFINPLELNKISRAFKNTSQFLLSKNPEFGKNLSGTDSKKKTGLVLKGSNNIRGRVTKVKGSTSKKIKKGV